LPACDILRCLILNAIRTPVLALLAALLLLGTACAPALVAIPGLDGVTEVLGYSLAPASLPEGFEFDSIMRSSIVGRVL